MAIHDYNVTASDVLDKIPLDTSMIDGSSEPVSTTTIDGYIDEAASELSGLLRRADVDGTKLEAEAEKHIQTAILNYAAAETLSKLGHTGRDYTQKRARYEDVKQTLKGSAKQLDTERGGGVKSTVNTSRATSEFQRDSYGF